MWGCKVTHGAIQTVECALGWALWKAKMSFHWNMIFAHVKTNSDWGIANWNYELLKIVFCNKAENKAKIIIKQNIWKQKLEVIKL